MPRSLSLSLRTRTTALTLPLLRVEQFWLVKEGAYDNVSGWTSLSNASRKAVKADYLAGGKKVSLPECRREREPVDADEVRLVARRSCS